MTKKLIYVLIILLLSLTGYVVFMKFDIIKEKISIILEDIFQEKIVIPDTVSEYRRDFSYQTFTNVEEFVPHNTTDIKNILYTILNNGWKDFTFYCPREYKTCATDVRDIANNDEFITLMNNYVNPYNSFMNYNTMITGDKTVYISVDKLYSDEDIKVLNEKIDMMFLDLGIDENMTTIRTEDIKNIHHYILNNTTYDKNYNEGNYFSSSNKANGVLLDGIAVCSGYADTLSLILDRLHVKNFKVSSEKHIWNTVSVNGKWLHIDATWDDDEINVNNRTNFFLVNTEELLKLDTTEHTFNKSLYLELN